MFLMAILKVLGRRSPLPDRFAHLSAFNRGWCHYGFHRQKLNPFHPKYERIQYDAYEAGWQTAQERTQLVRW